MSLHEAAPVVGSVRPRVDSEDDEMIAPMPPPQLLEHGSLPLARVTPRGEEVEHDGLPPERREREIPTARQALEREHGRTCADLRRRGLVGQLPHEQRREDAHSHHRERLRPEFERADHDRH